MEHQRCRAHNRNGAQCYNHALKGQHVCGFHGGKTPVSLEAARKRLNDLVDPSITRLGKLLQHPNGNVAMAAVKDVLDRAGYKPTEKTETDGRIVIEIEHVKRPFVLPES